MNLCLKGVRKSDINWAITIFKSFYHNNRFLGNSRPLKIRLIQCLKYFGFIDVSRTVGDTKRKDKEVKVARLIKSTAEETKHMALWASFSRGILGPFFGA